MVLLMVFLLAVLAVMLIYRRRKYQHRKELHTLNEKFARELLQSQLETQRETMKHIGMEIHDNVGHQLTLAFLYTQQAESEEKKLPIIEEVGAIINKALEDLRSLSSNLTAASLPEDHDLQSLLKAECDKVRSLKQCDVDFTYNGDMVETPTALNSFVLRIVQEFMQNSLKHSGCTQIKGSMHLEGQILAIRVEDNGKGFDLRKFQTKGIGISNIRKRAAIIGGSLDFKSSDSGTAMTLLVPIGNKSNLLS